MPTKDLKPSDFERFNLCGSLAERVTLGEVFTNIYAIVVRERERLGQIFADAEMPAIAKSVLDSSQDRAVFRWFDTNATLSETLDSVESEEERST